MTVIRLASIIRLKMSRPMWSVPRRNSLPPSAVHAGPCEKMPWLSSWSYGFIQGANMAENSSIAMTIARNHRPTPEELPRNSQRPRYDPQWG